ncbi:MAG TPA: hypothetical protein VEF34_12590 [Syntrophobacteraceae bacterium]|nr:hypothetical protein [Syntrophobacteraceae bacterium]
MTPTKIAAILLILAAGITGAFSNSALAAQASDYYGNQLNEIDFGDGTSIQYRYDANGNLVSKTPGSASQSYTITASAGSGGMISPSGPQKVMGGGSYSFDMIPEAGYRVSTVTVDGNSLGVLESYTFINVSANHTISAAFGPCANPSITVGVIGSGAVDPSPPTLVYGGSQMFTMTPNEGWYVGNVNVDGSSVGAVSSYTFTNVTASHSITVTFLAQPYWLITTFVSGGGVISPPGQRSIKAAAKHSRSLRPGEFPFITSRWMGRPLGSWRPIRSRMLPQTTRCPQTSAPSGTHAPLRLIRASGRHMPQRRAGIRCKSRAARLRKTLRHPRA